MHKQHVAGRCRALQRPPNRRWRFSILPLSLLPSCSTPTTRVAYFIPGKVHVDTVLITVGTDEILENFLEETYSAVFRAFSREAVHR